MKIRDRKKLQIVTLMIRNQLLLDIFYLINDSSIIRNCQPTNHISSAVSLRLVDGPIDVHYLHLFQQSDLLSAYIDQHIFSCLIFPPFTRWVRCSGLSGNAVGHVFRTIVLFIDPCTRCCWHTFDCTTNRFSWFHCGFTCDNVWSQDVTCRTHSRLFLISCHPAAPHAVKWSWL